MNKTKKISFLLIYLLCRYNILQAEIEQIRLSWNAFKCQSICVQQINQHFSAIQGVKNLQINLSAGIADMSWDTRYSLSYEPFRYAAAAVGININSMRVRVKGKIIHDSGHFNIISDQDGTRFHLIGPLHVEAGRYIPKYNLDTHPLPIGMKEQLLEIEKNGRSIVISGPLFLPSHYPLTLEIEQISTNQE